MSILGKYLLIFHPVHHKKYILRIFYNRKKRKLPGEQNNNYSFSGEKDIEERKIRHEIHWKNFWKKVPIDSRIKSGRIRIK